MKLLKDIHGGNPAATAKKLGLKKAPPVIYDFSVNINPFGMPSPVRHFLMSAEDSLYSNYPEIYADCAVKSLAKAHGLDSGSVIVANGSTEIFSLILQALKPKTAGGIVPCYSGYADVCAAAGVKWVSAGEMSPGDNFKFHPGKLNLSGVDLLFFCTPNNPSGMLVSGKEILKIALSHPGKNFVVDESFIDFVEDPQKLSLIYKKELPKNVMIVKSLTKFFAIAGLRLGMLRAAPSTIKKISSTRLPWSVNALSQGTAPLLYSDEEYLNNVRTKIRELRENFSARLSEIKKLKIYPSEANFILCEIRGGMTADHLQEKLFEKGILIRSCSTMEGLDPKFFRLAVLDEKANRILISTMTEIFQQDRKKKNSGTSETRKKMKPIMIVGTSSGSGKSLIVSALCRYFAGKGIKTAPFKAQNMSLNSFVTKEGGEIGRAQAVQARAAKIEPHTDMNPILLKPTGETGSQLIVNGKPLRNVTAKSYYADKCEIRKEAFKAFDRLASKYDLVILEGAGSPAEINILDKDFVNMAMAEYAGASAILVADIDKGGVFASIYGTIKLIPPEHKKLLSGVIINKFRGDVSLLKSGIERIEKLTGVPVLGVLPFVKDLQFEEEDSLGLETRNAKLKIRKSEIAGEKTLNISVIRLPRISNYTDFLPLENIDGVNLRYISSARDFGNPDLIIIPGTKNTIADLEFLKKSGLGGKIVDSSKKGIPVLGICGGYQMLGKSLSDPHGVEGVPAISAGLGLLPVNTVLEKKKELAQVEGITAINLPFAAKGTPFTGYEIHMGRSTMGKNSKSAKFAVLSITKHNGKPCKRNDGAISKNGLVFGTYVHGIFDHREMRNSLLKWLSERKGLNVSDTIYDPDAVFDQLADLVEKHILIVSK